MGDGRHCPHCGGDVTYRRMIGGRLIAVERQMVRVRLQGSGTKLIVVVDPEREGAVYRAWLDPEGDRLVWRCHVPGCPEWKPPEPKRKGRRRWKSKRGRAYSAPKRR